MRRRAVIGSLQMVDGHFGPLVRFPCRQSTPSGRTVS
jgi:hypothetical protein